MVILTHFLHHTLKLSASKSVSIHRAGTFLPMYSTESSDAPVGTSAPLPETRAEAVAVAQKPQKYRLSKGLWGFLGAAIVGVILQLTSKNLLWSSLDQWRGIGPPDTCSCLVIHAPASICMIRHKTSGHRTLLSVLRSTRVGTDLNEYKAVGEMVIKDV